MYNSRIDQGGEKAFDPDWHEKSRVRFQAVFTKVGEPLYGVDPLWECRRMLGGWSEHEIRLRHTRDEQWVEVTTALPENTRSTSDSNTLIEWISIRVGFLDEIAFPMELRVDKWEASVVVDGSPEPFVFIGDEHNWIADGQHAGRAIYIDGRGVDERAQTRERGRHTGRVDGDVEIVELGDPSGEHQTASFRQTCDLPVEGGP